MFPYSQYSYDKQEVLTLPVYDPIKGVYTVTGQIIYFITSDAFQQAKLDIQANIDATNNYDPATVINELQGELDSVNVALQALPALPPDKKPLS